MEFMLWSRHDYTAIGSPVKNSTGTYFRKSFFITLGLLAATTLSFVSFKLGFSVGASSIRKDWLSE